MPPKVLNRDYAARAQEEAIVQEFETQLEKQNKDARVKFFATLIVGLFIVGGYFYGLAMFMNAVEAIITTFIGR